MTIDHFANSFKSAWRFQAMDLAFRAAIQHGAFDSRLTPLRDGKVTEYNLGEHYETIETLADAIFAYITQDCLELLHEGPSHPERLEFPKLYDPKE